MSYGNESFRGVSYHVQATNINSSKITVTTMNAKSAKTSDLTVGATGTKINRVISGTLSINPTSIPATTRANLSISLTGATTNSRIILEPPSTLNTGLLYCGHYSSTNQINIYLYNSTGAPIDDGASTWKYLMFNMDPPL